MCDARVSLLPSEWYFVGVPVQPAVITGVVYVPAGAGIVRVRAGHVRGGGSSLAAHRARQRARPAGRRRAGGARSPRRVPPRARRDTRRYVHHTSSPAHRARYIDVSFITQTILALNLNKQLNRNIAAKVIVGSYRSYTMDRHNVR